MKRIVISTAVLALACAGFGSASAAPATTKITGGGQTLVPAGGGAGDTIAFTAQTVDGTPETTKGQFQYQDRGAQQPGNTQGTTLHGEVTCVLSFVTDEGFAAGVVSGVLKDGVTPFRVDLTDAGQGEQGADMVVARFGAATDDSGDDESSTCDAEDRPDDLPALSRGNVTIHKEKAAPSGGGSEGKGGRPGGLSL